MFEVRRLKSCWSTQWWGFIQTCWVHPCSSYCCH